MAAQAWRTIFRSEIRLLNSLLCEMNDPYKRLILGRDTPPGKEPIKLGNFQRGRPATAFRLFVETPMFRRPLLHHFLQQRRHRFGALTDIFNGAVREVLCHLAWFRRIPSSDNENRIRWISQQLRT